MPSPVVDVVVYGATGYTGRLICRELQRLGTSFAIAGRDAGKLAALAATLKPAPPQLVAAIDDLPALARMADHARVVLDCAGPFAAFGRPVQDAALAARRHFLDITGEHEYMLATYQRDAEARAHGVALINAVGFDVVPTDCAAVLAARAAGSPVRRVRIAFAPLGGRATQGTTRSALRAAHLGGLAFTGGKWVPEPVGAQTWRAPLPDPPGERLTASVPWGDIASAPRSTGADEVRVFLPVPPRIAPALPWLSRLGGLMRLPPVQALAERWVRSLPEGPTDAERARARFAIVAEADGAVGTRRVWVKGHDGYDFTAASAALCATWAAAPDFEARGAITPAQAFDPGALLDTMSSHGVTWGQV
ncbi:MAG: saccharopine dehydrogenase NADP-binding domain-containing protein [Deltaproteobacteria bacterium]|nr:saccharopine dehydrogenase NADP-binding domain-containing protein [Deltaproteobacteria bacterium]